MRGRPRKPTAELEMTGGFRHDRHGNRAAEPIFEGAPVKPKGMCKDASEHWDLVVGQLAAKGVATEIDSAALMQLCLWWARLRKYQRMRKGDEYRRLMMEVTAYKQWREASRAFGLDPVARTRLQVEPGKDSTNPFEAYLKQRGVAN